MLKNLGGRALELLDAPEELRARQVEDRLSPLEQMRSAQAGDEQVHGQRPAGPDQAMAQLGREQGAHAVSEKREWAIEVRLEGREHAVEEGVDAGAARFGGTAAVPGELEGEDLDPAR